MAHPLWKLQCSFSLVRLFLLTDLFLGLETLNTPPNLFPPPPDLPTSTRDIGASRRSAKSSPNELSSVSIDNTPSNTFPSKSPKHPHTLSASPRKTNQGVYIVNSVKATKVEPPQFRFGDLWSMPPEPNDEGSLAVTERFCFMNLTSFILIPSLSIV